jgi:S1-C subfamily serine protease
MRRVHTYAVFALYLVVLSASLLGAALSDWSATAKKVSQSIVYVENEEGSCTGFVINSAAKGDTDLILTAAHCDGKGLFADHETAKVIWKHTKADLMVLEVADTGRPAIRLADKNPSTGDEIASYGYGMALERPMFRTAHVSDDRAEFSDVTGGPFVMIDAAYVGGQSGGPVINAAGEIVSIVQRASGLVGIGVGAETIRDKAGKYFEKIKQP